MNTLHTWLTFLCLLVFLVIGTGLPAQPVSAADQELQGGCTLDRQEHTCWVTNPTSGAHLFVQAFYPQGWDHQPLPGLVLVPGGLGAGSRQKAQHLAQQGFLVIIFDPDGRGRSSGKEDQDGTVHQDGLAAVINAVKNLPGMDPKRMGIVSFSYGITMASGALARYPDLPVRFLIDWEGPANRWDTTVGCGTNQNKRLPACSDDLAWAQREAVTFVPSLNVPYQRIQSAHDHVQPDLSHAIDLVNAAVDGKVPWVRLNNLEPGLKFDPSKPPAMLPDTIDSQLEPLIAQYARAILSLPPVSLGITRP